MQHERFCHRLGRRAGDRKTISPGTALRSCRTAYPALSSVSTFPGLSACQTRRPGTCTPSAFLRRAPATYAGAAPSPGTTAPGSRPSPADLPGPLRCQETSFLFFFFHLPAACRDSVFQCCLCHVIFQRRTVLSSYDLQYGLLHILLYIHIPFHHIRPFHPSGRYFCVALSMSSTSCRTSFSPHFFPFTSGSLRNACTTASLSQLSAAWRIVPWFST